MKTIKEIQLEYLREAYKELVKGDINVPQILWEDEMWPDVFKIYEEQMTSLVADLQRKIIELQMTKQELCKFYVMSSWWVPYVSWNWAQNIAGSYYAWKTERRWKRYQNRVKKRQ